MIHVQYGPTHNWILGSGDEFPEHDVYRRMDPVPLGAIFYRTDFRTLYTWSGSAWETLGGGGGVPEAPVDGVKYARKDAAWVTFVEFPEAPIDGTQYARKNAAWEAVAGPGGAPSFLSIAKWGPM